MEKDVAGHVSVAFVEILGCVLGGPSFLRSPAACISCTPKAVLALLSLSYQEGDDASEDVQLTFSGSAAIKIQISALEISLRDVTKPYIAPSGRMPTHSV